jgi:hypothetical protein
MGLGVLVSVTFETCSPCKVFLQCGRKVKYRFRFFFLEMVSDTVVRLKPTDIAAQSHATSGHAWPRYTIRLLQAQIIVEADARSTYNYKLKP